VAFAISLTWPFIRRLEPTLGGQRRTQAERHFPEIQRDTLETGNSILPRGFPYNSSIPAAILPEKTGTRFKRRRLVPHDWVELWLRVYFAPHDIGQPYFEKADR
jgi:hypothetical protein